MKKILIVLLLFISSCGSMGSSSPGDLLIAQKFVPGTEDLPVYIGFKPVDANNVAYDSTSGRIVDASYFSTEVAKSDVQAYYTETLQQLGWSKKKQSEYIRDGERLKLSVTEKNGVTTLKFVIRPIG